MPTMSRTKELPLERAQEVERLHERHRRHGDHWNRERQRALSPNQRQDRRNQ